MIELRFLKKENGERVLQYKEPQTILIKSSTLTVEKTIGEDWQDVPVIKENKE